ncbi:MAG: hypothetical protein NW201_01235 [Gemmatimonadales bacterium]|nr:hypothetical protein [Gemmatimonadales bacterium]
MRAVMALGVLSAPATPAGAQLPVAIRFDATFLSNYIDRGVILGTLPVVQPALDIGLTGANGGQIGFGVLATLQPVTRVDAVSLPIASVNALPNPVELRPQFRLQQPFGKGGGVVVELLAAYRMFPNDSGLTSAANWGTVTTRLAFPKTPMRASLGLTYEVGAVQGAYVEGRVQPSTALTAGARVGVDARVGFALEQRVSGGPARLVPFGRTGLTHLEAMPYVEAKLAGLLVRPYLQVTYAQLPALPATYTGTEALTQQFYTTFGTQLSLAGVVGAKKPPPPPPPARRR